MSRRSIQRAFGELSAAAADLYARSRYSRHDEAAGGLPNGPLFRRILGRAHSATEFWRKPDREHDFATWLRLSLEDVLVLDAAAPGSYWDRVHRPLRSSHLGSALALLDAAMWASSAHGRALIQEAMGAIRQSEDS